MSQQIENTVIIGGGPAGLSAAIYLGRATMKPYVFAGSPPGGQLMLTTEVENFPGYEGIMGPDLVDKMREQATKFGSTIVNKNVTKVDFSKNVFSIEASNKEIIQAKSVVIATGAQALWLGLESEQKLRGRGVSACATCDGFFFRNKAVAVVGGGDTAMEEAITLTKFGSKVYVIHRRDSFRASKIMQERVLNHPNIEVVWNAQIVEVLGEQKVSGIRMMVHNQEQTISLDGVFLAIGHRPDTDLFKDQVLLDEKGYLLTSIMQALRQAQDVSHANHKDKFNYHFQTMTSIPGVFGAGDCVDHVYRQAGTAAAMGIAAALDVERWLLEL